MEVAIVSDTHMPKGGRRLPDACLDRLRDADLIVHAGDFSTTSVLRELEALGPPVVAVHGNVDEPALRTALPAARTLDIDEHLLAVVHDAGPSAGRVARLRRRFPEAAAVIFGHSHLPMHEVQDGFQIFNPGSPTERRRAPAHTMGLARAARGRLIFELVALD